MIPLELQPTLDVDTTAREIVPALVEIDKPDPWDKATWTPRFDLVVALGAPRWPSAPIRQDGESDADFEIRAAAYLSDLAAAEMTRTSAEADFVSQATAQVQMVIDALVWPTAEAQALRDYARGTSMAARRDKRLAALAAKYDAERTTPFGWDFGSIHAVDDSGADIGPAGSQTLQMRDDAIHHDQDNWSRLAGGINLNLITANSTALMPVRVTSNLWVQTTAADLPTVLGTMLARGVAQLAHYNALKAQVNAAVDQAALDAIDISAGWPS